MKKEVLYLAVLLLILMSGKGYSQFDPGKVCRLDGDQLFFRLESKWTDAQRAEISKMFSLDSILLVKAFEGSPLITIDSIVWQVISINPGIVEISKLLEPSAVKPNEYIRIALPNVQWFITPPVFDFNVLNFGTNELSDHRAFNYKDGIAEFFLPGKKEARKVFISGSFNNWSTMMSPMTKTDSGWIFRAELAPGRYTYKYIVDGKWMPDPSNRQKEDDTYNSYNSIVYCQNHLFVLEGYPDARKVFLSGSFNEWKERDLKMIRNGRRWELPVYLREGSYSYKYIVDGDWITDPANPIIRPDGRGNFNSYMAIGDTSYIHLKGYKNAKEVFLAGSFNAWNPGELKMGPDENGWMIPYVIAPGNYEYKFIVDGKWIPDPDNPVVSGPDGNSFMTLKPNQLFVLDAYPEAEKVVLSGSFNGWNTEAYRMYQDNGRWVFPIYLIPMKYTYKFIVDGNWILDPANELWEENEYGTNNSVLWVAPDQQLK